MRTGRALKHTQQIETLGRTLKATIVTEDSTDYTLLTQPSHIFYLNFVSYVVN